MKHLKTIMSVLAVLAAVSCAKTPTAGNGQVVFEVSSDQQIADMTRSNVSDFTASLPSKNDFTITITGVTVDYSWTGKISEWDAATKLVVGDYKVEASYGSLEEEGFDKPYFAGEASFAVAKDESINVKITVYLANSVVKMQYTDNFKNYYKDYSFKLSRINTEIVTFTKDETRAAFVDGWQITLSGSYTSELGKESQFQAKQLPNLDPKTAYTFIFDVKNVGGATLTITFKDNYTETVELGDYELND